MAHRYRRSCSSPHTVPIDRAVEALKLGVVDYITKPFDIEQLIDKTRRLIR